MNKIIKNCFFNISISRAHCSYIDKNMRLETVASSTNLNLKSFANWIIKIGDGTFGSNNDEEVDIKIPSDLLILESSSPLTSKYCGIHISKSVDN